MSISAADFDKACHKLKQTWQDLDQPTEWAEVKFLEAYDRGYLRIARTTVSHQQSSPINLDPEVELHEDDAEVLTTPAIPHDTTSVHYDIIYSPTYQVPVLYIRFSATSSTTRNPNHLPSASVIYDLLVPEARKEQLRHIGLMGALSMTDHPITAMLTYFVHPCLTSEAMASISSGSPVDPMRYLLIWLGLVGGTVGLNVPVELARALTGVEHVQEVR